MYPKSKSSRSGPAGRSFGTGFRSDTRCSTAHSTRSESPSNIPNCLQIQKFLMQNFYSTQPTATQRSPQLSIDFIIRSSTRRHTTIPTRPGPPDADRPQSTYAHRPRTSSSSAPSSPPQFETESTAGPLRPHRPKTGHTASSTTP